MDIKLLDHGDEIRKDFKKNFVLSWEDFQVRNKASIERAAASGYALDLKWYSQALMWDRMAPNSYVHFREALLALSEHKGNVYIMGEGEDHRYPGELLYRNERVTNFVAQVDADCLARLIEEEWLVGFGIGARSIHDHSPILPEDLYVFDESMDWYIVFTHEADDLNAQFYDKMKAADSRVCLLYKK